MSAIPSVSAATPPASTNAFSALSSEEFVRIIFSELTNQDPLAPNDTGALLDQLSSIRAIESDLTLGNNLKTLVSQNQLASASSLIGKFVTGLSESGVQVADLVVSVTSTRDGALLNLAGGFQLNMSRLQEIIDLDLLDTLNNASGLSGLPAVPALPGDAPPDTAAPSDESTDADDESTA